MGTIDATAKDLPLAIARYIESGNLDVNKDLPTALRKASNVLFGLLEFRDIPEAWLRTEGASDTRWKLLFDRLSSQELRDTVANAIRLSEAWLKIDLEQTKAFLFECDIHYYAARRDQSMPVAITNHIEATRKSISGSLDGLRKMQEYYDISKIPNRDDAMDVVESMIKQISGLNQSMDYAALLLDTMARGSYNPPWYGGI